MSAPATATPQPSTPSEPSQQPSQSVPGQRPFSDVLTDPANFISELEPFEEDIDAGEGFERDEATPPAAPAAPKPAAEPKFVGIKSEVVELMKQISASDELDLNDPKNFKLVRRLAESQHQISASKLNTGPQTAEEKNYLDLFNDPTPQAPAAPKAGEDGVKTVTPDLIEPGWLTEAMKWANPEDFTPALQAAFDLDEGPAKNQAVSNAMLGFVHRTFEGFLKPALMQEIRQIMQAEFEPVMRSSEAARDEQMRGSVVEKLEAMEEYSDIRQLYDLASNEPLVVDGVSVEDTHLNRILAKYPDVLKIQEDGKTKAEKARRTYAARLRMAYRIMKAERNPTTPNAARQLIQTGQRIEQSKRDPTRTSLNAPSQGAPTGGRGRSTSLPDRELMMSDI